MNFSLSSSKYPIPIFVYSELIKAFLPFFSLSASLIIIFGINSSISSMSVIPIKALFFSENFSFNLNLKSSSIWYLIYELSSDNFLTSSFANSHNSLSGFNSGVLTNSFMNFSYSGLFLFLTFSILSKNFAGFSRNSIICLKIGISCSVKSLYLFSVVSGLISF